MATAMGGVISITIMAMGNGVAITMAIDIGQGIGNPMGTVMGTGIGNPITTRNLSMFRHQCTMGQYNHPASVCFFR
jgi:hypothetical protein